MTDTLPGLFRSAINFINNQGIPAVSRVVNATTGVVSGVAGGGDHPLVGQTIEVEQNRVKIQSLLAEGGFALVFSCQNQEGKWMALKRQIATDAQSASAIKQEIRFAKELSGHPAIMRFVGASQAKGADGRLEFYLLTELCSGGPLIDVMQRVKLQPDQVLKIFYALCCAVHHMHDRNPPITHRDLKIENLLFDAKGRIKLCDFGSATTEIFRPDDSWSVSQRTMLEEDMQRFTTPMYRAPEILDTYQNFPIGPSQDVWALGCILIYLCYGRHPFEDSAKLAIVNAKYRLPKEETPFSIFHPIVESLLQPDPYSRPMISDICERLEAIAAVLGVKPTDPVTGLNTPPANSQEALIDTTSRPSPTTSGPPLPTQPQTLPTRVQVPSSSCAAAATPPPPRPPPPRAAPSNRAQTSTPPPRTTSIRQSEEERIRASDEEKTRRAHEEHMRILAEEVEYRQRLAAEHEALKEMERQRKEPKPTPQPTNNDDDLFAIFDTRPQPSASSANLRPAMNPTNDLLGDWPSDTNMHRNSSAPSLDGTNTHKKFDPFADFLASSTATASAKSAADGGSEKPATSQANVKSASNSGRSTPGNAQKMAQQQQDRKNFDSFFSTAGGNSTGVGPKFGESAFDDLLSSQGFSSTAKNAQRSLASIKREEEVKIVDPITLKIRDWTQGKEGNIRALLGSLDEVLWEEAVYSPPSVAELISDANVKRHYRKALLVMHPDKQTRQPHEQLAKAIFTELRLAWEKFNNEKTAL